ncbi:MAG: hypothetical protein GY862_12480 [Gammaproteobacteria bacterium]|nr:hypothetical protein [Gammaproteobacteria bacterium]
MQQGLYSYDALARLQEAAWEKSRCELPGYTAPTDKPKLPGISRYLRLGPLGTAFVESKPRRPSIVLIDEIDKSDIDLPNDLLHLFEEGEFEISELARLPRNEEHEPEEHGDNTIEVFAHGGKRKLPVSRDGIVHCEAFPLVIMTSNGEREFPPAFLRRCLRLTIKAPGPEKLGKIVRQHLGEKAATSNAAQKLIKEFLEIRGSEGNRAATDQLLNAIYLVMQGFKLEDKEELRKQILAVLGDN